MDVHTAFKYEALGATDDGLRLVVLMPGDFESDIDCQLIRSSISKDPEYEALSYMWGDTTNKSTISVHGQKMEVTRNLWSALRYLRSRNRKRTLWIDAICIDQSNIHERNHQVGQMGLIYSRAREVIVWLGVPTLSMNATSLDTIFHWISKVSSNRAVPDPFQLVDALKEISQGVKSARRRYCGVLRLSSVEVREVWREFVGLCSLEYWHRVWIVQEVVLAQKITLQLGNLEADWTGLATIFKYLEKSFELGSEPQPILEISASLPVELHRQRSKSVSSRGCSLESLLRSTERSMCTDPRDKVYALLSLAKDCSNYEIQADYSLSVSELYLDVMRLYISRGQRSKIVQFSHLLQRNLGVLLVAKKEKLNYPPHIRVRGTRTSQLLYVGQPWVMAPSPRGVWHPPQSRFGIMMDTLRTKVSKEKGLIFLYSSEEKLTEKHRGVALARWHSDSKNWSYRQKFRDSIHGLTAYFEAVERKEPKGTNSEQKEMKVKDWRPEHVRVFENQLITVDSRGNLGLVPSNAQFGDSVVEFEGCGLSLILRRVGSQFVLIGSCFMATVKREDHEEDERERHSQHPSFDLEIGALQLLTQYRPP